MNRIIGYSKNEFESGSKWTLEETEIAIEAVLKAKTEERFRGVCDIVAKKLGRTDGDVVSRHIWGVMNWFCEYIPTTPTLRNGPATFGDIRLIKWAANSNTRDKRQIAKPTPIRTVIVIRRPTSFVVNWWKCLSPAMGRRGLLF